MAAEASVILVCAVVPTYPDGLNKFEGGAVGVKPTLLLSQKVGIDECKLSVLFIKFTSKVGTTDVFFFLLEQEVVGTRCACHVDFF